jgi:hypothetical protein
MVMIEVKLLIDPTQTLEIVKQLKNHGLKLNEDFDFCCIPTHHHWSIDEVFNPRHTIFKFYNDSLSSWFILKYT